ncbi:hypothetical protein ACHAWF_010316 [Thalassiosira exigua]
MKPRRSRMKLRLLFVLFAAFPVRELSALVPYLHTRRIQVHSGRVAAYERRWPPSPPDVARKESSLTTLVAATSADASTNLSPTTIISDHLEKASLAASKDDSSAQQEEMERAEQALVQRVDAYRGRENQPKHPPDAQLFGNVIQGLLALPSSFTVAINDGGGGDEHDEEKEVNDQIRRAILGKGQLRQQDFLRVNNKSDKATRILDLMESIYEPTGSLYDAIIASHGTDSLQCLSYLTSEQDKGEDEESKPSEFPYYRQAWKAAISALKLLDRCEDLYHETGHSSSQLPSISSYVTVMDVWKGLAVAAEGDDEKKKRDDALEVVRSLRSRRLKVYTLDVGEGDNSNGGGYNVLPLEVLSLPAKEVLDFSCGILRASVPSYQLDINDPTKIGTWHFNQLIFDLAKYPQPYSGPLAQDLLNFMVDLVKKASRSKQRKAGKMQQGPRLNVPKPTAETINGVLKAWVVTPNCSNVAQRAEAVLAKLAIWQSEGLLWGISADTVSYNICINAWKHNSHIKGAAQRATEILNLMEDQSTTVAPDVISYATCIGAWADCASQEPSAGRCAEEILMRMVDRNKNAGGDESIAPRPTTRCFNAVLLAYANGRQRGGGKRALELLRFMETLNSEGSDLSPDTYTFNIVIKAMANCREDGAARKANNLLQMMELSYSKGDTRLKPDLITFNTVLDAWGQEGDAQQAERLIEKMLNKGDGVKPNAHSYTAVLTAWSRSKDKSIVMRRAEDLFDDIERRYAAGETDYRADTSVYNALINCWAKSGERKALYRVTQLLSLMEELGLQGGDSDVQPNSRTYCAVLDTLARSKNYKAVNKSTEILQRMEDFYSKGYGSVRPCTRAYSIVISTIARSRQKNKAVTAQELLHRMESEYRAGNSSCRPNVFSYNAVLNACGK